MTLFGALNLMSLNMIHVQVDRLDQQFSYDIVSPRKI